MEQILGIGTGVVLLTFMGAGMFWCWRHEIKEWNGGRCRKCGDRFYSFDMSSQGDRGYRCALGHYIWISYPGVDRDYEPPPRKSGLIA